jgi:hypothetical protein
MLDDILVCDQYNAPLTRQGARGLHERSLRRPRHTMFKHISDLVALT